MPVIRRVMLAALVTSTVLLYRAAWGQSHTIHITTSDAVKLAQMIARDEGYDIRNDKVYYFDMLPSSASSDVKPLLQGYTSIGFYINVQIRSSISINEQTGQAIDVDTCEVFDYPDLKPFQRMMTGMSKARLKSPQELAHDAGCESPKVLSKPLSYKKNRSR